MHKFYGPQRFCGGSKPPPYITERFATGACALAMTGGEMVDANQQAAVLQSAADYRILMLAGGKHTIISYRPYRCGEGIP